MLENYKQGFMGLAYRLVHHQFKDACIAQHLMEENTLLVKPWSDCTKAAPLLRTQFPPFFKSNYLFNTWTDEILLLLTIWYFY